MSTTMPETATISRIAVIAPSSAAFPLSTLTADERLDLGAVIGLDLDLVLGTGREIPAGLSDQEHDAACFESFTEQYTRVSALVDMLDSGFVDVPRAYGRLLVLADELQAADDADGYQRDELDEVLGGRAA
ncbi:hypothetical protein QMK19_33865 [Streptomyces sp. H10-C2]|uniref:hypothetical protein n=1 Tax=unclassified Streptomyces TaxID=2593676 RepID=UPI0024B891A1|nr:MULTISPECIES: hypothetical protein [unclassified Streptomyces]MDJ0345535.1 hypothetical protein [Streptomyces sp. PH10-H1]MDJ0374481.1 hypothetical protein [Streptomyces sp. H10-C2]